MPTPSTEKLLDGPTSSRKKRIHHPKEDVVTFAKAFAGTLFASLVIDMITAVTAACGLLAARLGG